MATISTSLSPRIRAAHWLTEYILPLGWVAMLTGMFWIGDRSLYHKLYYGIVAVPALVILILQPKRLRVLITQPLFLAFVAFSAYMMLTLLWSKTDDNAGPLLKRPLYIGLLLLAAGLMAMHSSARFITATRLSAMIAVLGALALLGHFFMVELPEGTTRLSGMGALYNPLLTSHVLGAFAAYWMATVFRSSRRGIALPLVCLAILVLTILATGSRTPLVGLLLCFAWLVVGGHPKRGLVGVALILVAGVALALLYPEAVLQRGLSYRPEIWAKVLGMVAEQPWFGYGYGTEIRLTIPSINLLLSDPHNIELGVLYEGGIVGLMFWAALYAIALIFCWRLRNDPHVSIAGTWLVFGLGAGLTEGGAFFSRPKEHWLLIWLPMAFVYALSVRRAIQARTACGETDS